MQSQSLNFVSNQTRRWHNVPPLLDFWHQGIPIDPCHPLTGTAQPQPPRLGVELKMVGQLLLLTRPFLFLMVRLLIPLRDFFPSYQNLCGIATDSSQQQREPAHRCGGRIFFPQITACGMSASHCRISTAMAESQLLAPAGPVAELQPKS
jgi:hypothetical protein